jgi:uncharacterized protein (DUF2336 family)
MADRTDGADTVRGEQPPFRYADAKRLAADRDPAVRARMAADPDAPLEVLFFLAADPDPIVRTAVAGNPASPHRASEILAVDPRNEVRLALARRLAALLPGVDPRAQERLHAVTVAALERLALDQLATVREILAETLKDVAHVPEGLAATLARDVQRAVAEPMLRFCAALPDRILCEIVASDPASWRVEAVSARPTVSATVADAIVATGNEAATDRLIRNPGAVLSNETLFGLAAGAGPRVARQEAIAIRPNLPADVAHRLAAFAENSVLLLLGERDDLTPDVTDAVGRALRRGLESGSGAARANRLFQTGDLDDDAVAAAMDAADREFVLTALSLRAGFPEAFVARVLASGAPLVLTALALRARLSMTLCVRLQLEFAGVPPSRTVRPAHRVDYPLTDAEAARQLAGFRLMAR